MQGTPPESDAGANIAPGALSALLQEIARGPTAPDEAWLRPLHSGQVVGRFELVREIGRGGFGVVYEARDRELGRSVAFKAVRASGTPDVREERLLREAEAAARLSHPNIVTLYDVGRCDEGPYLVLELLHGQTLARRLDEGPLPLREALRVAMEVAKGLSHAHGQGVVHRDLTPGNVFLCDDGQVKVLDFGMAHAFGQLKVDGGTRSYMAPEQWRGAPEDERTDIFALGVVLYRMLTGELPFTERQSLDDPSPAPRLEIAEEPALAGLVARMLEKDPVKRPRHAGELLGPLATFQQELARPASAPVRTHRRRPGLRHPRAPHVVGGIALLITAGGLALYFLQSHKTSAPHGADYTRSGAATLPSIAVLPFADVSPRKDQEYFSDGLADEILSALSRVEGLRVPGRASSFYFKGKNAEIAEIGRRLNVGALLEGSVRTSGSRVRVTAEIVTVADGYRVWTQTYDRELTDVFAVQDEIAAAVVDALKVKLLPGQAPTTKAYRTMNPEAHAQYLLGRHFYGQGTTDAYGRSVAAYDKALALDPDYAAAHAWLSQALRSLSRRTIDPNAAARMRARALAEAERAIDLGPELADAYSTRAVVRNDWTRDWRGAQADATRATTLNPGDAVNHRRLALVLATQGRLTDAALALRRSTELDPLDPINWRWLGTIEHASGRRELAQRAWARALEIAPDEEDTHLFLGIAYVVEGRPDTAIAEARLSSEEQRLELLALAEHDLGHPAESQRALDELVAKYAHNHAVEVAAVHAWRGDRDRAFEWLNRAADRTDEELYDIKYNVLLLKLHGDQRWNVLLRKMNLPLD